MSKSDFSRRHLIMSHKASLLSAIIDYYHLNQIINSQHELLGDLGEFADRNTINLCCDKHEIVNMLLHLVSAPPKGKGLIFALRAASIYVKSVYLINERKLISSNHDTDKIKFEFNEISILIDNLIEKLKLIDKNLTSYNVNSCYGLLTHNPIYGYCCFVGFYLQNLNFDHHLNKIDEFAYYLHELLLLRVHVRRDVSENTLEYLARVARKFIAAPPENNYQYSGNPAAVSGSDRKQFFRDLTIARNKESGKLLYYQVDETFVRRLLDRNERIVKGTRVSPDQRFFGRVLRLKGINGDELQERDYQVIDGTPSIIDPNSIFQPKTNGYGEHEFTVKQFISPSHEVEEALDKGECEDECVEQEVYIYPSSFFKVDTWPNVRAARTIAEHVTFNKSCNIYDLNVYTPNQLRRIFEKLALLESQHAPTSPEYDYVKKMRLIISLMLFVGITRSNMNRISGAPEDLLLLSDIELFDLEVASPIIILPDESAILQYYSAARWANAAEGDCYITTINPYRLILPDFISNLIPPSIPYGTPYFLKNDLLAVSRFLKQISKEFRLSFLTNSFRAYFSGSGMPELSLRIIAGDIPFYLRSQAFYNTMDWNHLNSQWRTMCASFKSAIEKGAKSEEILELMTYHFEDPATKFSNEISSYVGANRTPMDHALIDHFQFLYDQFPHNAHAMMDAEPRKWNAYVAYLHGLFGICTGKRPIKHGLIDLTDLYHSPFCHVIADKKSAKYNESRTIFLCPTLQRSLIGYDDLLKNGWAERMIGRGFQLSDRPASLTMVDETNNCLMPFSTAKMDDIFGENSQYISGMLNAHRHYLLSRLARVGVSQSWIDFISGHRHGGTEPEYNTSLLNWRQSASRISDLIEDHIVDHLHVKAAFDE